MADDKALQFLPARYCIDISAKILQLRDDRHNSAAEESVPLSFDSIRLPFNASI